MSSITAAEKALLESRPHRTKLWLSIYQPTTVLACRVNEPGIGRKERTITYNGAAGDYNDVESGMVMYVGSSAGSDDKGRIRVKSITDTVITVAENSHIDWANTDHLTIVNFFEITAIYPRIVRLPGTDIAIFYKDYDITYSGQNRAGLGAFVCMGPHRAGFLHSVSGTVDMYYSAEGTEHMRGDTMSYLWSFEGGDPTGSTAQVPGYVTYDTPGHYTTKLKVSGDTSEDYSYRHVSIYDRPEDGTDVPILQWELTNLTGSRKTGGYKGRLRIYTDVDDDTIRDGYLVTIFADDWYDHTKQSIGGNFPNADSIVFNGYILDGSIEYNYQKGYIEFEIGSPTEVMKTVENYVISVESRILPLTWWQLYNMNCKRALYHYLRWHSTALMCNDFEFSGTDQDIQYFDTERTSLYDAIRAFIENTLVGNVVADRQGKVWAEVEAKAINNAATSITASDLYLDNYKWMGAPAIQEAQKNKISYLEMGGIAYHGPPLNLFNAYLSMSPGEAPDYEGSSVIKQGLALESQNQLNILCGNVFAWENARYPSSTYKLNGNYRNYDIAPQEIVKVSLDESDTPRKISFSNKDFIIQDMQLDYLAEEQVLLPTIKVAEVTQGIIGETLIIPVTPPTDTPTTSGTGGGGYDIPPFDFPDIPPIPPITFTGGVFTLYDEGQLQGIITGLNAIGTGITATITGTTGVLTFNCDNLPTGSASGIYFTTSQMVTLGFDSGVEYIYNINSYTKNGMTVDATFANSKVICDVGGTYKISLDSKVKPSSGLLPGFEYTTYHWIRVYSSGGAQKYNIIGNGTVETLDTMASYGFLQCFMNTIVALSPGDYVQIVGMIDTGGDTRSPYLWTAEPNWYTIYKI